MKHDCSQEFDTAEIYRKLTSQSSSQTVKAYNFFQQSSGALLAFQQSMSKSANQSLFRNGVSRYASSER